MAPPTQTAGEEAAQQKADDIEKVGEGRTLPKVRLPMPPPRTPGAAAGSQDVGGSMETGIMDGRYKGIPKEVLLKDRSSDDLWVVMKGYQNAEKTLEEVFQVLPKSYHADKRERGCEVVWEAAMALKMAKDEQKLPERPAAMQEVDHNDLLWQQFMRSATKKWQRGELKPV